MTNKALSILVYVVLCATGFAQLSINGYRNAVIADASNDPGGIQNILTGQVAASGLTIVHNPTTLNEDEAVRTCLINWNQHGNLTQYCDLTIVDALSGRTIVQVSKSSRIRFGVPANVVGSVENAWKAVKYTGYNPLANQANINVLFPKRPVIEVDEAKIREMELTNPIEGIWTDTENRYTVGIIRDPTHKYGDFVGVILRSKYPTWGAGEIKFELRDTSVRNTYTGNVYLANKSCQGSTLFIEGGGALLHYDATSPDKTVKRLLWVKNFPKIAAPSEAGESVAVAAPKASWTGSGFLMSEGGLVATNHHVAGPASSLRVLFPMAGKEFKAKLVLKDPNNDLAILQLEGFTLVELHQSAIPYGLARSRSVSLGDSVFTIGYPLSQVLGKNAKFSNGTISSKSGVGDDMVHLQINVPIQPGNSGSPLFDARGNIIGIIVASLNTDWMQQKFGVVPQNVNFAVKSDYLINLAEMLPDPFRLDQAKEKVSPDQIEPFICLISANP